MVNIGTDVSPKFVPKPQPNYPAVIASGINPIDLAVRQHVELLEKIGEVNKNLKAIQLAPITIIYLVSVSVFFWIGKINEWIWVMMTLYPLTPIYGDRFLKFLFDMRRKG